MKVQRTFILLYNHSLYVYIRVLFQRSIKKIVGHKGQSVTEVVYTHFEIEELIDAINKI